MRLSMIIVRIGAILCAGIVRAGSAGRSTEVARLRGRSSSGPASTAASTN